MKWPTVKLGDICTFTNGGTPSKDATDFWCGEIPWISSADIVNDAIQQPRHYITAAAVNNSSTNQVPAGTLLVVTRTGVGKVAITDIDLCFSQDITALHLNTNCHSKYIAYAIKSHSSSLIAQARGATIKGITRDVLASLPILLPPLAEQQRIAAILDKAEEIKRKREQAIAKLDELAQSTFVEMFGDPVINSKNWDDSLKLKDIAEIGSGITKGRKTNGLITHQVPYLAVSNVQDKALNLKVVKTIEATEDEINRYRLKRNDLLLTEGGDPDKLGRGTLWNNEIDVCIHQNHIFKVRITSNKVNPSFLNWLVGSARGKEYFLKSAKQTTGIASINMTQLKNFPMLLPPLAIQEKFETVVNRIKLNRNQLLLAEKQALELIKSLQHQAFTTGFNA